MSWDKRVIKKYNSGKAKQPEPGLLWIDFGHFPSLEHFLPMVGFFYKMVRVWLSHRMGHDCRWVLTELFNVYTETNSSICSDHALLRFRSSHVVVSLVFSVLLVFHFHISGYFHSKVVLIVLRDQLVAILWGLLVLYFARMQWLVLPNLRLLLKLLSIMGILKVWNPSMIVGRNAFGLSPGQYLRFSSLSLMLLVVSHQFIFWVFVVVLFWRGWMGTWLARSSLVVRRLKIVLEFVCLLVVIAEVIVLFGLSRHGLGFILRFSPALVHHRWFLWIFSHIFLIFSHLFTLTILIQSALQSPFLHQLIINFGIKTEIPLQLHIPNSVTDVIDLFQVLLHTALNKIRRVRSRHLLFKRLNLLWRYL
jgi:hypothetical protein